MVAVSPKATYFYKTHGHLFVKNIAFPPSFVLASLSSQLILLLINDVNKVIVD